MLPDADPQFAERAQAAHASTPCEQSGILGLKRAPKLLKAWSDLLMDSVANMEKKEFVRNPWPNDKKSKLKFETRVRPRLASSFVDEAESMFVSAVRAERISHRNLIDYAKERKDKMLWASTRVAHAIGAKNRYKYVQHGLEMRGVGLLDTTIKIRVRRFENKCRRYFRTPTWPKWTLLDLFSEFRISQWKQSHKGKLPILHEAENGALTFLTPRETSLISEIT
jgi:hypothetical protein